MNSSASPPPENSSTLIGRLGGRSDGLGVYGVQSPNDLSISSSSIALATLPSLTRGSTPHHSFPPSIITQSAEQVFSSSGNTATEFSILGYLADLQNPSEVIRQRGLRNVRIYIEVLCRGVSPELFAQVMDVLCDRLYVSLGSDNPYCVLGVILAIDALVSTQGTSEVLEDTYRNCCIRFISFLRILFQTKSVFQLPFTYGQSKDNKLEEDDIWKLIIISKAATALSHVAREGLRWRMNATGLIDYDLKRAFEWLIRKSLGHGTNQTIQSINGETHNPENDENSSVAKHDISSQATLFTPTHPSRRLAAVLLLKEAAHSVPMIMQAHLQRFFTHIWIAIQEDENAIIRAAGVEALGEVLHLLYHRDTVHHRLDHCAFIWKQIRKKLPPTTSRIIGSHVPHSAAQIACWQGSLLALGELLNRKNGLTRFMWPRFITICRMVLTFCEEGFDGTVYEAVVRVIPRLAELESQRFVKDGYLTKFVQFLLKCLECSELCGSSTLSTTEQTTVKPEYDFRVDSDLVLSAIGDMAISVGHSITGYIDVLLPHVLRFLGGPAKEQHETSPPWLSEELEKLFRQQVPQQPLQRGVFGRTTRNDGFRALGCTIKLVKAAGPSMINYIHSLIDRMFTAGISEGLFVALQQLAEMLPPALPIVQSRILSSLAKLLAEPSDEASESEEVVRLSLAALGYIGVEEPEENHFVVDCVLYFLEKGTSAVLRRQAALTVIQMLLPHSKPILKKKAEDSSESNTNKKYFTGNDDLRFFFPSSSFEVDQHLNKGQPVIAYSYKLSRSQMNYVQRSVQRLVYFAVSESDPQTRAIVLDGLNSRFDPFLSSPPCATALAQALHDEDITARRSALRLFARLTSRHEGTMLHALNQLVIELLSILQHELCWVAKDKAAQLLSDLMNHSSPLIAPYARTLLGHMLKKLKEAQTELLSHTAVAASQTPGKRLNSHDSWIYMATAWQPEPSIPSSTPTASNRCADVSPSNATTSSRRLMVQDDAKDQYIDYDTRFPVLRNTVRSLLKAVASLCDIMLKDELIESLEPLTEVLLGYLMIDSSSDNWIVDTLQALSALWRNACRPVQPYRDFPFLLPFLLHIVQSGSHSVEARRAVLGCLGVLGALDPHQYDELTSESKSASSGVTFSGRAARFQLGLNPRVDEWTPGDNSSEDFDYQVFLCNGKLERPVRGYMMQQIAKSQRQTTKASSKKWTSTQTPRLMDDSDSVEEFSSSQYESSESDISNSDDEGGARKIDFFSRYTAVSLLRLLGDPSQNATARSVGTQALLSVLKSIGSKSVVFTSIALPALLNLIANSPDPCERTRLLNYTAQLISVSRQVARPFFKQIIVTLGTLLDNLVATQKLNAATRSAPLVARVPSSNTTNLISRPQQSPSRFRTLTNRTVLPSPRPYYSEATRDHHGTSAESLSPDSALLLETQAVLCLLSVIWKRPMHGIVGFGHRLLPKLTMLLRQDSGKDRSLTATILNSLDRLGPALNDHIYLIIPACLTIFEKRSTPVKTKLAFLNFIRRLVLNCDLSMILSRIVHPLHRTLQDSTQPIEVKEAAIFTLKVLHDIYALDLRPFVNLIRTVVFDQHLPAPSPFLSLSQYLAKLHESAQPQQQPQQQSQLARIEAADHSPSSPTKNKTPAFQMAPSLRSQSCSTVARPNRVQRNLEGDQSPTRSKRNPEPDPITSRFAWNRFNEFLDADGSPNRPHSKSASDVRYTTSRRDRSASNQSGNSGSQSNSGALMWVNEAFLRQMWSNCSCTSPEEWSDWLRRLTVEMARESSAQCIRDCAPLVQLSASFTREIFPAVFLSCWIWLSDAAKLNLAETISKAVSSLQMSLSDLQQILNLAEVMAIQDESLYLDVEMLVRVADRCHACAKSLSYRELQWRAHPELYVEPLIALYDSLQQRDSAVGVLTYAQKYLRIPRNESWTEKLQQWNKALQTYEIQQLEEPESVDILKGRLRCLYALGHWDRVSMTAEAVWESSDPRLKDPRHRVDIAKIATAAELNLQNYLRMVVYVKHLEGHTKEHTISKDRDLGIFDSGSFQDEKCEDDTDGIGRSFEGAFFGAILKINEGEYIEARKLIQKGRGVLEVELAALLAESYTRAYRTLVKLQQLTELEEAILFKQNELSAAKNLEIKELWARRLLEGCQPDADVWHSILQVRAICLPPHDDIPIWLKFASLSRKQERFGIALRVISDIRKDERGSQDPRVFVAYTKTMHAVGQTREAHQLLKSFCKTIACVAGLKSDSHTALVKPSAVCNLFRVIQYFSVSDLLNLKKQMKRIGHSNSSCHRYMSSSLVQTLTAAGLFCPALEYEAKEHFAAFGLTPIDVNLLLASCHLKLSKWSQSLHELSSQVASQPRRLIPDANHAQIASGQLLGGWCSVPGLLVEVCNNLRTAIKCCPEAHKVWRDWAELNFQLAQTFDQSRGHGYQPLTTRGTALTTPTIAPVGSCSQHAAPVAALSLEVCPVLSQLEQEQKTMEEACQAIQCHCPCHEYRITAQPVYRRLNRPFVRNAPFVSRVKEADHILKMLEHFRRSLALQVKQHLGFVVDAAGGFVRSIALRPSGQDVQELLRLLTVWFRHAEVDELNEVLREGFTTLPTQTWIPVIPQILARLKTESPNLILMIRLLIGRVAESYPEALVFPMMAASGIGDHNLSDELFTESGQNRALELLESIALRHPTLVAESRLVSEELIRVSILSPEKWHETLEETSRLFYNEKNIPLMVRTLVQIYDESQNDIHTFRDLTFAQTYARDLGLANLYLRRFIAANNEHRQYLDNPHPTEVPNINWKHLHDLDQAWQIFYVVFSQLWQQISRATRLDLQYVSPKLKNLSNLQIAVPGRYTPLSNYPKINAFDCRVDIFSSKQRPRKIRMLGSDGKEYAFLVKGHEDLRQDERVMQVLTLINRLLVGESFRAYRSRLRLQRKADSYGSLEVDGRDSTGERFGECGQGAHDFNTRTPKLCIPVYSVVPLSTNSGIIEWVSGSDTLHSLVKRYRRINHTSLSLEHDLLKKPYAKYEELPLLQKMEVFKATLAATSGNDLREILWRTSRNSETWLERRSNFTSSLALMSMAGYVLGLGDRHPSNLMLMRTSGQVVYIDFGDCFEVASLRDRFPERIPFRLTRMLLNAMEIGGIDGRFKITCERVLRSLRSNRDAIVATLETFVYDPLVTWRLLAKQHHKLERILKASALSGQSDQSSQNDLIAKEVVLSAGQQGGGKPSYAEIVSKITPHCTKCRNPSSQQILHRRQRCISKLSHTVRAKRRLSLKEPSQRNDETGHYISDRLNSEEAGQRSPLQQVDPKKKVRQTATTVRPMVQAVRLKRCYSSGCIEQLSDSGFESEEPNEEEVADQDEWETNSDTETQSPYGNDPDLFIPSRFKGFFQTSPSHQSLDRLFNTSLPRAFPSKGQRQPVTSVGSSRMLLRRRRLGTTQSIPEKRSVSIESRTGPSLSQRGVTAATDPALLSKVAEMVLQRIETKLNGTDFGRNQLDVPAQVERLIEEATSIQNLAQCFVGWCAFW